MKLMDDNLVLQVDKLYGGYGKHEIIHGIDLHIYEREIVCIIGPNGSGKSTLIKIIYGLANHKGGNVQFRHILKNHSSKIYNISGFRASDLVPLGIAYVPQKENVFPKLTVEENLDMGGYTLSPQQLKIAKDRVFEAFPILLERKTQRAKTLSGGQRQLLALGRALMIDPTLIILDEPSAALQPSLVIEIMNNIRELRDNQNVTVLIVEQNVKSALQIADRGYILAAGQMVYTESAYELQHNTDLGAYYLGGKK